MKKEIKIDETIVNEIQRLQVEVDSRKNLIAYLMSNEDVNISQSKFDKYHKEYQEKFFEYNLAKEELEKTILAPEFGKENLLSWSLDFSSGICTVTVKE